MYVDEPADAPNTPASHAATTLSERMVDVAALDTAVKSGQVTLEPEAGQRLLTTLRGQADAAAEWLTRLRGMSRPVPLGTNWVGEAMSGKFERRADGEDVSFVNVLAQYHQMLLKAHDAVDHAIRGYQSTERGSAQAFHGVSGELA
ncbi:hypothetical protein [Kibdelosporangium aridum]|uniref:Uncharacterized protein n=1 Tax=Kibdelosporangium aridum TaxID=2030 RepID=A0A1W2DTZ8_KIBAR|nr:hypothetical protein [Kibdelosporangium aridum]SMD00502.1 hypothetical protein SAMN05661093_03807 [Kibdelosporangium aridum]